MNYLFYSKKCEHSKMLSAIIKATPELKNVFKKICVDLDPITKKRNHLVKAYGIKGVPSLVFNNQTYEGDMAFQFVEQVVNQESKSSEQGQEQTSKSKAEPLSGVQSYSSEFNGTSDAFSTFGEEKPDALPRSFALFGGESSKIIQGEVPDEKSKKHVALDFEKLMAQRAELEIETKRV